MKLRRLRRWLAGRNAAAAPADPAARRIFARQTEGFLVAQTAVRAFYAVLLYFLASAQFPSFGKLIDHPPVTPLWPVAWLSHAPGGAAAGVRALLSFYGLSTLLGVLLPGPRWARGAAALGLLELVALQNSYGKIGHSLHLALAVAGLLILLPAGWERRSGAGRRTRQETLLVFWTCQAAILLSYTMSGLGKLGGALWQLAHGQPNAFFPGAVGAHIAERLLQTHSQSTLGAWVIDHPWLTWPPMPGAIYLELFAFAVAFRPALARPWAAALITFHLGVFFAMTINFPFHCLLLALFFFQSPFALARVRWQRLLLDLPLFGAVLKVAANLNRRNRTGAPQGAGTI